MPVANENQAYRPSAQAWGGGRHGWPQEAARRPRSCSPMLGASLGFVAVGTAEAALPFTAVLLRRVSQTPRVWARPRPDTCARQSEPLVLGSGSADAAAAARRPRRRPQGRKLR